MKKLALCWLLLGTGAAPALAQTYMPLTEFDEINRSIGYSRGYERLASRAKGTPDMGYYQPAWLPGNVVSTEGKTIVRPALRYNIALQVLEARDSTAAEGIRVIPASAIGSFTLGLPGKQSVHAFESQNYLTPEGNVRGYFEPLNKTGDLRLFLYYHIAEKAAQRVEALAVEVWPARLTRETNLYVLRPGQAKVTQLALSRAAVLRLFGKQAGAVEAYAAQHKLNLEDVDGAARAVDYYNTLPR